MLYSPILEIISSQLTDKQPKRKIKQTQALLRQHICRDLANPLFLAELTQDETEQLQRIAWLASMEPSQSMYRVLTSLGFHISHKGA